MEEVGRRDESHLKNIYCCFVCRSVGSAVGLSQYFKDIIKDIKIFHFHAPMCALLHCNNCAKCLRQVFF